MELSASEQQLLDFALKQFGRPLSLLLLAGLGEEAAGLGWRFTITYAGGDGVPLERYVEAISHEPADGPGLFPRRRDPLILLALLQLLMSGGEASRHDLIYNQGDILNLLGWNDTLEAKVEIDEAVDRYSLITFKWTMSRDELTRNKLSHYTARESLISEYETADEEGLGGQMKRLLNRVVFSSQFIEQLRRRSLFGINWDGVQSVIFNPIS